jgi:hypothetical protein
MSKGVKINIECFPQPTSIGETRFKLDHDNA